MIEMQAPLYAIKKQLLKRTMEGDFDKAIIKYQFDHKVASEEKKPHS